jgi:site-specific recombinase XerC
LNIPKNKNIKKKKKQRKKKDNKNVTVERINSCRGDTRIKGKNCQEYMREKHRKVGPPERKGKQMPHQVKHSFPMHILWYFKG